MKPYLFKNKTKTSNYYYINKITKGIYETNGDTNISKIIQKKFTKME